MSVGEGEGEVASRAARWEPRPSSSSIAKQRASGHLDQPPATPGDPPQVPCLHTHARRPHLPSARPALTPPHLIRQLSLVVVHECGVWHRHQRPPQAHRLKQRPRPRVADHQRRGAQVLPQAGRVVKVLDRQPAVQARRAPVGRQQPPRRVLGRANLRGGGGARAAAAGLGSGHGRVAQCCRHPYAAARLRARKQRCVLCHTPHRPTALALAPPASPGACSPRPPARRQTPAGPPPGSGRHTWWCPPSQTRCARPCRRLRRQCAAAPWLLVLLLGCCWGAAAGCRCCCC